MGSGRARAALAAAVVALAAAALAPAAGADGVELLDEATAEHCPPVSLDGGTAIGGCAIHFVTDQAVAFRIHTLTGIETGENCAVEFAARLDEAGSGYLEDFSLSSVGMGACGFAHCPVLRPLPRPIALWEAGGEALMEFEFCYTEFPFPSNVVIVCPFRMELTQLAHAYEAEVLPTTCEATNGSMSMPYPLEIESGRFESEAPDEEFGGFELVHL